MTLYAAMREILVEEGPLENLYADRLPPEQTAAVDVAHIPQGGTSPQRYLGSSPVIGGPLGVEHDGGILWHLTNVQFRARSESAETVMEVADWVRDVLVQYAGTSVVKAGEEIIRCDITTAPHYYGQDEQERIVLALTVEVWHNRAA